MVTDKLEIMNARGDFHECTEQPLFWIHQGRYPLGHRVPDCGRNHVGRDWVYTGDCVRWLGEYGLCGSSAGTEILID